LSSITEAKARRRKFTHREVKAVKIVKVADLRAKEAKGRAREKAKVVVRA
jgi:hypothetical protein